MDKDNFVGAAARGLRLAASIAISTAILGLAYGASVRSLQLDIDWAIFSSGLVFTGAAQFALLPFLGAGATLWTAVLVTFLVSLRLILMGGSISIEMRGMPVWQQIISIPLISDGSWLVAMAEKGGSGLFPAYFASGVFILSSWILGTWTGFVVADDLPMSVLAASFSAGNVFLFVLLLAVSQGTPGIRVPDWAASGLVAAVTSLILPVSVAFVVGVAVGSALVAYEAFGGEKSS